MSRVPKESGISPAQKLALSNGGLTPCECGLNLSVVQVPLSSCRKWCKSFAWHQAVWDVCELSWKWNAGGRDKSLTMKTFTPVPSLRLRGDTPFPMYIPAILFLSGLNKNLLPANQNSSIQNTVWSATKSFCFRLKDVVTGDYPTFSIALSAPKREIDTMIFKHHILFEWPLMMWWIKSTNALYEKKKKAHCCNICELTVTSLLDLIPESGKKKTWQMTSRCMWKRCMRKGRQRKEINMEKGDIFQVSQVSQVWQHQLWASR